MNNMSKWYEKELLKHEQIKQHKRRFDEKVHLCIQIGDFDLLDELYEREIQRKKEEIEKIKKVKRYYYEKFAEEKELDKNDWRTEIYYNYPNTDEIINYLNVIKNSFNIDEVVLTEEMKTKEWQRMYEILERENIKIKLMLLLDILKCVSSYSDLNLLSKEFVIKEKDILLDDQEIDTIQNSITQYLDLQLSKIFDINLNLTSEEEKTIIGSKYIGGGCTHEYANIYNSHKWTKAKILLKKSNNS